MKAIKAMARYIKRHPVLWAVGLIVPSFAALGTNLAFAYGLEAYTAELVKPDAVFGRVVFIMLATLAILVITSLIEDAARYFFAMFIVKTENNVRQDLFTSLVRAKYTELGNLDRGEVLTRYNADSGTAANLITWDLFAVLWPIVLGMGYLISVFAANRIIGFVMLALCVVVILLNIFYVKRFAALEKKGLEFREGFIQMINGAVRGKMSVRLLSAGGILSERIGQEAKRQYDNGNAWVKLSTARACTLELFSTICGTLTAPLACILAALGLMPLASVVLIAQLCRYLILYTNGFGVALTSFGAHSVSYTRLQRLLGIAVECLGTDGESPDQDADTVLECNHAGISYGGHDVLTDVCLSIKRGEIVALIGPSGSGKSSIVKALLRLIDYSGEIRLFGRDIQTIALHALRQSIAYVPEHNEIFDATVSENLSYAAPDADAGRIHDALHMAAIDGTEISEREVGEGGGKVSGGQRQRVAIARALLKDAPLIILDEPTASLDTESERKVLETLIHLKKQGKSMLIITHRPSTMKIADRFMLIQNHRIIGGLTYEETAPALFSQSV